MKLRDVTTVYDITTTRKATLCDITHISLCDVNAISHSTLCHDMTYSSYVTSHVT